MKAQFRKTLQELSDAFWTLPAAIVLGLAGLAFLVVDLKSLGAGTPWIPQGWIYGGGDTGARTLLGAIATSTVGVAGTLFSITIAALTLASSQMGPRLLRNFMRDRGNQVTLGALLGTFAYALIVLRSVRGQEGSAFVPALGVTIALVLAGVCIALLIYFVHHVASRINVDTVLDLVQDDLLAGMMRLTFEDEPTDLHDDTDWSKALECTVERSGYLQQIDVSRLLAWAEEHDTVIRFLSRPGDFIFPGRPIFQLSRPIKGAQALLPDCVALSRQGGSPDDLTFPIAQLVEVAVRALSPGINDPRTAISVLNRLGATLSSLAPRHLDTGMRDVDGKLRLFFPPLTYLDLTNVMFELIRESAGRSPSVLIHMMSVLSSVAQVETAAGRIEVLKQHAEIIADEGRVMFQSPVDRTRLDKVHAEFRAAVTLTLEKMRLQSAGLMAT